MRVAALATIFIVLGVILSKPSSGASLGKISYTPSPSIKEIIANPNRYLSETLRSGITPYQFWKAASRINTFFGFESLFKKQAEHNPFVWRQGGSFTPAPAPRGRPIAGIPFDTHTGSTAIIPGCLHQLCPPPQAALWVDGICWCTP